MRRRDYIADPHRPYVDLLDRAAVLAAAEPVAYRRIRLHYEAVRRWFGERAGWPVVMTRELVRLIKTPAVPTTGEGFRWAQSPLDYELFIWTLWYGEQTGADQFILSELVQELAASVAASVGSGHLDWDSYTHRQALRRALVALEEMGALRRLDGSVEEWASGGEGNTLYEFAPLAPYLSVYLPEAVYVGLVHAADRSVLQQTLPGAGGPEQRLYRHLLLSPALYAADDPEAFALLRGRDRRRSIAADIAGHLGWDLELTGSHASLLRPAASEAGEAGIFPFRGALSHVVLLLSGVLRERVATGQLSPDRFDRLAISPAALERELVGLSQRWGTNWGSTLGRMPVRQLADELAGVMGDWGLLAGPDADGQYTILPLAARLQGSYRDDGQGLEGDEA